MEKSLKNENIVLPQNHPTYFIFTWSIVLYCNVYECTSSLIWMMSRCKLLTASLMNTWWSRGAPCSLPVYMIHYPNIIFPTWSALDTVSFKKAKYSFFLIKDQYPHLLYPNMCIIIDGPVQILAQFVIEVARLNNERNNSTLLRLTLSHQIPEKGFSRLFLPLSL